MIICFVTHYKMNHPNYEVNLNNIQNQHRWDYFCYMNGHIVVQLFVYLSISHFLMLVPEFQAPLRTVHKGHKYSFQQIICKCLN